MTVLIVRLTLSKSLHINKEGLVWSGPKGLVGSGPKGLVWLGPTSRLGLVKFGPTGWVRSNRFGQVGSGGLSLVQRVWSCWFGLRLLGLGEVQLVGLGRVRCNGLGWVRLGQVVLDWVGFGLVG